jgi:hypothetical protein
MDVSDELVGDEEDLLGELSDDGGALEEIKRGGDAIDEDMGSGDEEEFDNNDNVNNSGVYDDEGMEDLIDIAVDDEELATE